MPIYAYKCSSCGYAKDVLQKMSDAPLTVCPSCGAPTFAKQVTAAGFQLKGSGWYVTDFRDGGKGGAKDSAPKPDGASNGAAAGQGADAASASSGSAAASPAVPAAPAASPAAAPAAAPASGTAPPSGSG